MSKEEEGDGEYRGREKGIMVRKERKKRGVKRGE